MSNRLIMRTDFNDVVRMHAPAIFQFVVASVRDQEVAQDLTQECFGRAFQGWSGFRGDCSAHTWLRHIALNVIRNSVRSKGEKFWKGALVPNLLVEDCNIKDRAPSPEAQAIVRATARAIWKAAEAISPKQRLALQLRFIQELELVEIATLMGISEGAVKVHLARAVRSVRITLEVRPRRQ